MSHIQIIILVYVYKNDKKPNEEHKQQPRDCTGTNE